MRDYFMIIDEIAIYASNAYERSFDQQKLHNAVLKSNKW